MINNVYFKCKSRPFPSSEDHSHSLKHISIPLITTSETSRTRASKMNTKQCVRVTQCFLSAILGLLHIILCDERKRRARECCGYKHTEEAVWPKLCRDSTITDSVQLGRSDLHLINTDPLAASPALLSGSSAWVRAASDRKRQHYTKQKTEAWKHWRTRCVLLLFIIQLREPNTAHTIKTLRQTNKQETGTPMPTPPTHATGNKKSQKHFIPS